jgi:hypothetical protein
MKYLRLLILPALALAFMSLTVSHAQAQCPGIECPEQHISKTPLMPLPVVLMPAPDRLPPNETVYIKPITPQTMPVPFKPVGKGNRPLLWTPVINRSIDSTMQSMGIFR